DWSAEANRIAPDLLKDFWRQPDESIRRSNEQLREHQARMAAQGHSVQLRQHDPFSEADRKDLQRYIDSDSREPPKHGEGRAGRAWSHVTPAIHQLAAAGALTPVAALKMLSFFDLLQTSGDGTLTWPARQVFEALHRRTGHPTLLELSTMLDECGLDGKSL